MCMRRLKSDFSRSKVGLSSEQSLGFLRANSDFATYLLYRIVDTGSQSHCEHYVKTVPFLLS